MKVYGFTIQLGPTDLFLPFISESDPYPIDALPTCNHALSVCQNDQDCQNIYNNFQQACKVQNDKCQMETW